MGRRCRAHDGFVENGPKQVIWTRNSRNDGNGMLMSDSTTPGPRHLRMGFKKMIEVGSVLVRGGGRLSVLKPDAAYPGDVADEKNWLPAEWLQGSAITSDEVYPEQSAIWILPPGTKTRAIRFTHTPLISDAQYGGRLGGALIMAERVINVAPLALPATSANHAAAAKINNEIVEGWLAWDNGKTGAEKTISAENSEWLMLVWPRAVSLSGLEAIWAGYSTAEAQIYAGPADKHPRDASEAEWKTLKSFSDIKNGYPTALWPNAMPFGETVFTRAVRLRVTAPTTEGGHLNGKTSEGKRIWLGELMALQPIVRHRHSR